MYITFTPSAKQELARRITGDGVLQLTYDTEGCGCAVNGIAQLWMQSASAIEQDRYETVDTNDLPYRVVCHRQHTVFFDDRMTVDYSPQHVSFMLKSE